MIPCGAWRATCDSSPPAAAGRAHAAVLNQSALHNHPPSRFRLAPRAWLFRYSSPVLSRFFLMLCSSTYLFESAVPACLFVLPLISAAAVPPAHPCWKLAAAAGLCALMPPYNSVYSLAHAQLLSHTICPCRVCFLHQSSTRCSSSSTSKRTEPCFVAARCRCNAMQCAGAFKRKMRIDTVPAYKTSHFVHLPHGTARAHFQRATEFQREWNRIPRGMEQNSNGNGTEFQGEWNRIPRGIEPQAEADVTRFSE